MFISLCIDLVMLPFIIWWCEEENNYGYTESDFYWRHKIYNLEKDLVQYKHELLYPSSFKYNHQLFTYDNICVEKIVNRLRLIQVEEPS
jgi:hypothetical protein